MGLLSGQEVGGPRPCGPPILARPRPAVDTWSDSPGPWTPLLHVRTLGLGGAPGSPSGTHEPGQSPARKRPPRPGSTDSRPLLRLGPETPCPCFPGWAQKHGAWRPQRRGRPGSCCACVAASRCVLGLRAPCTLLGGAPRLACSAPQSLPLDPAQWCLLPFCPGSPVNRTGGSGSAGKLSTPPPLALPSRPPDSRHLRLVWGAGQLTS